MTDYVGYQCRSEDQLTPGTQTETAQTMMLGVSALVGIGSGYVSMSNGDGADDDVRSVRVGW